MSDLISKPRFRHTAALLSSFIVFQSLAGFAQANTTDFDDDGATSCGDVTPLYQAIRNGNNVPRFDLNGDGVVDNLDLVEFRTIVGVEEGYTQPLQLGDADLNGVIDERDLNRVAQHWNTGFAASWCQGDFNVDGITNEIDLNALAQNWRSDIRSVNAATAVPEPASAWASIAFLLAFAACSRNCVRL